MQAVKQLTEEVATMPEDACSDLLILPLYAAMPLELQVCHSVLDTGACSLRLLTRF